MRTTSLLIIVLLLVAPARHAAADTLAVGSGSFEFVDAEHNAERPITVWFHQPEQFRDTDAIVFVMHGTRRNAQGYRDRWVKHADQGNFLLLVPEFSNEYYPSSRRYQQGYLRDGDGLPREQATWTFTAIERLFDHVVAANDLKQERYIIYGHSAGGQFVHRLAMLMPEARFELAIAANAGWYVMPQFDVEYPHGLAGTHVGESELRQAYANRLVVLIGSDDNDPDHPQLAKSPHAMSQGQHRLARALWYFSAAAEQARQLGAEFRWQLQTVPGVGHSNAKMAAAAAGLIP